MDFIFDNIDTLIVIAIFAVSILGSLFKKRKPADDDSDEADDAPPSPVPQIPRPAPRQQPVDLDEEMRRTLEDIFADKQPSDGRRLSYEDQKQTSSYDSRKAVNAHTRANAQPQAARKVVRPGAAVDDEWMRALREREAREAAKTAAAAEAFALEAPEHASVSDGSQTLLAQARNGIIWSEILQPPVSMR